MVAKKKSDKSPSKDKEVDVVLVTPTRSNQIHMVTPFEWFRLTVDEQPFVGMYLTNNVYFLIDKKSQLSCLVGRNITDKNTIFLDYLTEEENVTITGSAKERAEITEDKPSELPFPSTPKEIMDIPDNIPFKIAYDGKFIYNAVIRKQKTNDRRGLLLIGCCDLTYNTRTYDVIDSSSFPHKATFVEYIDQHHISLFDNHEYRKVFEEA